MDLRVRAALGGLAMLCAAHAIAQGANVAAIQASEARKADARTLAALEAFRHALIARFGADPTLTMLRWSESEGSALVQTSGGATEYVIRQGDAWVSTANRKLVPWAPPAVATANAFRLSSVKSAPIRAWLDAWRKAPGQATDFITDYEAGYEPSAARLVVRARVGSMTTFGLAQHAFDPSTGSSVTIAAAPRQVPKAIATAQRRTDDLRRDASAALAALRKVEPSARLGSMRISQREIAFTLADRRTWTFDPSFRLTAGRPYDGSFLCAEGWLEDEVDWTKLAALPRNGVLAANLDDEDEAHARFTVDRSRGCGPLTIEVTYDNYRIPQPWARFDARGRYLTSR